MTGLVVAVSLAAGGLQVRPHTDAAEGATPVTLEIIAPVDLPAPAVQARTNMGRLDAVEVEGPGRWSVVYHPPKLRFPAVAVVVVSLASGDQVWHAGATIALLATAEVEVSTLPGAEVEIEVAGAHHGPEQADRRGRARFVLPRIPPGVTGYTVIATHPSGRTTRRTRRWSTPSVQRLTIGPFVRTTDDLFEFAVAVARVNGELLPPARVDCHYDRGGLERLTHTHLGLFRGGVPEAGQVAASIRCQAGRQRARVELRMARDRLSPESVAEPLDLSTGMDDYADVQFAPELGVELLAGAGGLVTQHGQLLPIVVVGAEVGGERWGARLDAGLSVGRDRDNVELDTRVEKRWWSVRSTGTIRYRVRPASLVELDGGVGLGVEMIRSSSSAERDGVVIQPDRSELVLTPHGVAALGVGLIFGEWRVGVDVQGRLAPAFHRIPATAALEVIVAGGYVLSW